MTSPADLQCFHCLHRHPHPEGGRKGEYYCAAFPDGQGIPNAILANLHRHTEPYPGDRGIRFLAKTGDGAI
jgi:hypothetical protein